MPQPILLAPWKWLISLSLLLITGSAMSQEPDSSAIDFRSDIQPILADTCYKCHGPDEEQRQADLRLDTRAGLFEASSAVVPGDVEASELLQRVFSDDPDLLMPPPDSGRQLTESQKKKLQAWVQAGAPWANHWSLVPPVKPDVPETTRADWIRNPIDAFVAARLQQEGLEPAPEAPRSTLIRRVTFDLTGLPPAPELLKKYQETSDPNWYVQLVDELLQQPAYGEHMARYWLDAARYGDTHGLHLDNYREMWAYRDWVIDAFNRNLSYRDFTIEQLAGDMLENPSQDQLIASGFNRAHVTTNEGGSITEEVYVRNVVDRVSTTGTVFLGMTIGCAQCHDHKFDPISQREFYQLFAYFNNMTDPPMDNNAKDPQPVIQVLTPETEARQQELQQAHAQAVAEFDQAVDNYPYAEPAETEAEAAGDADQPREFIWIEGDRVPQGAKKNERWQLATDAQRPAGTTGPVRIQTGQGIVQHFITDAAVPLTVQAGDVLFADVYLDPQNPPAEVMLQFNDGNWEHRVRWGGDQIDWGAAGTASRFEGGPLPELGTWVRLEVAAEDVGFQDPRPVSGFAFTQFGGTAFWGAGGIRSKHPQPSSFRSLQRWLEYAAETEGKSLPNEIKQAVTTAADQRTAQQNAQLRRHFLLNVFADSARDLAPAVAKRDAAKKTLDQFVAQIPTTLVSRESDQIKQAFFLNRGQYDLPGDPVSRQTPAALPPMPADLPNNRLGLAQWLTLPDHPLTARVAVNRFWQQLFGTGIVRTSEDFGAQGEVPTHPALLDWLATDFVEHDWDVKRLMKQIVLSATYRQDSRSTPAALARDPENRLLSHGPRFRLDAEMLRDQALAVSGLLNRTMGGPSVKPPQPSGLWFAVGYTSSNTARFKADTGPEKVYRRSVYTFWKRTAPPPQMNTFDAPSREECAVRRERTNTPLQALLLMNEPQYLEAARQLGRQAQQRLDQGDEPALAWLFERCYGRPASDNEREIVSASLQQHRQAYEADPDQARQLVTPPDAAAEIPVAEAIDWAAFTMVANTLMNADEFVTKN